MAQQFEGDFSLGFHLAPPLFGKKDAQGQPVKSRYGAWMMRAMRLLARAKGLRGSKLDIFGYSQERKRERQLIANYCETVLYLLQELSADNLALAIDIASLPEQLRGYGHVKAAALEHLQQRQQALLARFRMQCDPAQAARMAAA